MCSKGALKMHFHIYEQKLTSICPIITLATGAIEWVVRFTWHSDVLTLLVCSPLLMYASGTDKYMRSAVRLTRNDTERVKLLNTLPSNAISHASFSVDDVLIGNTSTELTW